MGDTREYSIRRMNLNDIGRVCAIEKETFTTPWSENAFFEELTKNKCARYLVLEANINLDERRPEEHEVVAYGGIWCILEEGHITNIAVKKNMRGRGYGKAITKAVMQYAANLGVDYITLEVRRSNLVAQDLYKKLGFEAVGYRKRYYEDNQEDALLMVCQHLPGTQDDFTEEESIFE